MDDCLSFWLVSDYDPRRFLGFRGSTAMATVETWNSQSTVLASSDGVVGTRQVEETLLEKAAQKAAQVVLDKDLKKTDQSAPPQNPASPFQQVNAFPDRGNRVSKRSV